MILTPGQPVIFALSDGIERRGYYLRDGFTDSIVWIGATRSKNAAGWLVDRARVRPAPETKGRRK